MGVSLTIWSPIPGSGKTVFTFLLACRLSQLLKKDINILVCSTCMADGQIMGMAGAAKGYPSLEELVNAGIPANHRGLDAKGLLYNIDSLYFTDSSNATALFVRKNADRYLELMGYLKQKFDLVINDTSSDPANPLTDLAMDSCDHVLSIAVQDMQALEKNPCTTQKSLAYIINRYAAIYPDKKELAHLFGMKDIYGLPFCSQLMEMKNRQQLYRYAGLDTEYMKAIDKLAVFLMKTLNLPQQPKKDKKDKNGIIQLLKKGERQWTR